MNDKNFLRIKAKNIRKTLDINAISNNAVIQIRNNELYKNAKNILIFYPKNYEINLLPLLNDDKNFYLPKICNDSINICPFKNGDNLSLSCFRTKEPCTNPVDTKIIELAILPGLMADKENYRLGYGGGFYDRFLAKNKFIKTIMPVAKELIIKTLPHDENDVQADLIIPC